MLTHYVCTRTGHPGAACKILSRHPSFKSEEGVSATKEFRRLCKFMEWDANGIALARESFSIALTKQFNLLYGTDVASLEAWQSLCYRVGVSDPPESVLECRKVCSARTLS